VITRGWRDSTIVGWHDSADGSIATAFCGPAGAVHALAASHSYKSSVRDDPFCSKTKKKEKKKKKQETMVDGWWTKRRGIVDIAGIVGIVDITGIVDNIQLYLPTAVYSTYMCLVREMEG
jgi:hypothetical protein